MQARELMHEKEVIAYDPTSVDTVTAFEAWGLNIADLEKRHKKLCELERRRNNA